LDRAKEEVEEEELVAASLVDAVDAAAAGLEAGAGAPEAAGLEAGAPEAAEAEPLAPVMPPVAPVAAIRASASAVVVQVMEVPALLTNGRAVQVVPPAQAVVTKAPLTHWANAPPTQACWPLVQEELAVKEAN
jgi:hypothetical protein